MSMQSEVFDRIERHVDLRADELIHLRRHFHTHPELSREEFATTRRLAVLLEAQGYEVHMRPEGTGLYADWTPPGFDPTHHPTVAIRSDIDALPIAEQNDVPYASQTPGVMHACGHDVHMATVMGAAMALGQVRDALRGRLRFIFQHAEEATPGGALEMVAFGAIDGVHAVLGLHCDPELPVGQIGIKPHAFTAATDTFQITLQGSGGHGARPHLCTDPVYVATQLATALYHAFGRRFDVRQPAALSIGVLRAGATPNVIPTEAYMAGTIRTICPRQRAQVEEMLRQIAAGICMSHGTSFQLHLECGAPAIHNHPGLVDIFARAGREIVGAEHVYHIPLPSMGGEDFSYYLERAPGAMFRLGTARTGPRHFLHSPHFDVDERAIALGARLLCRSALYAMDEIAAKGPYAPLI